MILLHLLYCGALVWKTNACCWFFQFLMIVNDIKIRRWQNRIVKISPKRVSKIMNNLIMTHCNKQITKEALRFKDWVYYRTRNRKRNAGYKWQWHTILCWNYSLLLIEQEFIAIDCNFLLQWQQTSIFKYFSHLLTFFSFYSFYSWSRGGWNVPRNQLIRSCLSYI